MKPFQFGYSSFLKFQNASIWHNMMNHFFELCEIMYQTGLGPNLCPRARALALQIWARHGLGVKLAWGRTIASDIRSLASFHVCPAAGHYCFQTGSPLVVIVIYARFGSHPGDCSCQLYYPELPCSSWTCCLWLLGGGLFSMVMRDFPFA